MDASDTEDENEVGAEAEATIRNKDQPTHLFQKTKLKHAKNAKRALNVGVALEYATAVEQGRGRPREGR